MGSLWRLQVLGQILGYPDQRFNILLELPFKPDQATSLFVQVVNFNWLYLINIT
jgi:hypothetical protein